MGEYGLNVPRATFSRLLNQAETASAPICLQLSVLGEEFLRPAEEICGECPTWNTDRIFSGWIGKSPAR
jgi:hypothetical protein